MRQVRIGTHSNGRRVGPTIISMHRHKAIGGATRVCVMQYYLRLRLSSEKGVLLVASPIAGKN